MKPRSGRLTRVLRSFSELLYYKATQARIRFQEADSSITETADRSFVRRRIGAAAVVLLLAKSAFTIRTLVLHQSPTLPDGVILGSLLGIAIWLYSPRNMSMLCLRTIETLMFLGISVQLGMQLHDQLGNLAVVDSKTTSEISNNAIQFVAVVKDQIIATIGMMMIYGMFIPNTAKRAALMVFLMAVIPAIVIGVNESSVKTIERFRLEHIAGRGIFPATCWHWQLEPESPFTHSHHEQMAKQSSGS